MKRRVLFAVAAIAVSLAGLILLTQPPGGKDPGASISKGPAATAGGASPTGTRIEPRPSADSRERAPRTARQLYLSEPDRAKVFTTLEQREEPEAKYFAFRAAADCAVLLGSASDWNDVAFETASTFPGTALDRDLDQRRRDALARLATACRAFTRPNTLPRQRMSELLAEAAAAGQPAAVAAARWREHERGKAPVDLEAFRAMGEAAFASGDFFAVLEAEGAVLSMRHSTPIAGLGSRDPDVLTVAMRLAECHLSKSCGASGLLSAIHCAMEAKCYDDPASYFLSTLPESDRPKAVHATQQIVAAIENRSLGSILTKADGRP